MVEKASAPIEVALQPSAQFAFLCSFHRSVVGESVACLGVEVQAPTLAPVLELLRAHHGSDDMSPASALLLFPEGSCTQPFSMRPVQGVAVGHEALDLLEVLFQIPDHADH